MTAAGAMRRLVERFAPVSGELPRVWVPASEQWVETTRGRVTQDGYSWMQSAHWVVGSGCYVPVRSHGPRAMNVTTLRVAQELAVLSPCRPGVEFLAWRLRMSERAVEYHLSMLRESGLLAYVEKGTRYRGKRARASEFALVIPPQFDAALGIRTTGEGPGRRVTGIAEAGRDLVAKLARKAARKVRAPRTAAGRSGVGSAAKQQVGAPDEAAAESVSGGIEGVVDGHPRCTPMEAGTEGFSGAALSGVPLEAGLASGKNDHAPDEHQASTAGPRKGVRRKVNKVRRRFQLAAELIRGIGWLSQAHIPRVAWVVGEVSDAGWTPDEVTAWLAATGDAPTAGTWRPSGLLASRLRGVTGLPGWRTAAERAEQVEHWRDSRRAARARHTDQLWMSGDWQAPTTPDLVADVESAFAAMRQLPDDIDGATVHHTDDPVPALEDLTPDQVIELRGLGMRDHNAVLSTIDLMGEVFARRLYTHRLVDWVLHQQHAAATAGVPW
ncbi:transcriptional regulator [Yinghuangia aomiensis]